MENVTSRMESVRIPNILKKGNERQSESTETNEKEKGEKKQHIKLLSLYIWSSGLTCTQCRIEIQRSHSKLIRAGYWIVFFLLLEQQPHLSISIINSYPHEAVAEAYSGISLAGGVSRIFEVFPRFLDLFHKMFKIPRPPSPPTPWIHPWAVLTSTFGYSVLGLCVYWYYILFLTIVFVGRGSEKRDKKKEKKEGKEGKEGKSSSEQPDGSVIFFIFVKWYKRTFGI